MVVKQLTLRALALIAFTVPVAVLVPLAVADSVYHSEHLALTPVGAAPLRSGFVENIKAQGPQVYAHEIVVLNGAVADSTYTATRRFFFLDPECDGALVFSSDIATLVTNAGGDARGDVFVAPEEAEGLAGVHGVMWTVENSAGAVVYRTTCTAVTLD
jgi:hypothetical protein